MGRERLRETGLLIRNERQEGGMVVQMGEATAGAEPSGGGSVGERGSVEVGRIRQLETGP